MRRTPHLIVLGEHPLEPLDAVLGRHHAHRDVAVLVGDHLERYVVGVDARKHRVPRRRAAAAV